jgi:long-subunit fatty acid transport protein
MKKNTILNSIPFLPLLFFLGIPSIISAQEKPLPKAQTGAFWNNVQFGGAFGISAGNDYTDIIIAPSAIYNFNDPFSVGLGLQYSHLKQRNFYTSNVVGGSVIGLFNPVEEVQLSLEVEEIHVSNTYSDLYDNVKRSFWSPGLYIGAGYCSENVTIGARFNVLFDRDKDIYGEAFMPFVRVYF